MTKKIMLASAISAALLTAAMPGQAQTLPDFLSEGDLIGELRGRIESVKDDDNTREDALAITTRARIGYETPNLNGFKLLAEFDQVIVLQDEYDSLTSNPDNTNKSVIADGQGGDFNRFQISYNHEMASAVLGRQTISFDNGRFIGNEGWRQNEQTFDSFRVDLNSVENLNLTYVYINQVNTVDYEDLEKNDHLLNLGYQTSVGKVVTYAYLLEDSDTDETNNTFGLRFSGDTAVADDVSVLYSLEYAGQAYNTGISGDDDETSDYNLVEIGVNASGITFLAGMEKQSGDGSDSFSTLYSSGHEFNGWADAVPAGANGLVDSYAKLGTNLSGFELAAIYHDFSSDEDSDNLGDEINLLVSKDFNNNFSAGLKLAQYSAGDFGKDSDKVWLWAEAKF